MIRCCVLGAGLVLKEFHAAVPQMLVASNAKESDLGAQIERRGLWVMWVSWGGEGTRCVEAWGCGRVGRGGVGGGVGRGHGAWVVGSVGELGR